MKVRNTVFLSLILALTAGCYVQSASQRDKGAEGDPPNDRVTHESHDGECRYNLDEGCFEGNLTSRQKFYVEGEEFFNADDLALHFDELIKLEKDGLKLERGEDYKISVLTPLKNGSFAQGFEYDLSGPAARTGDVRRDGHFRIDELPEGRYKLRLQKTIRFEVEWLKAEEQAEDGADDAGESEDSSEESQGDTADEASNKDLYCAVIYSDSDVDILDGERKGGQSFDDFRLHLSDRKCDSFAGSGRRTLSL